MRRNYIDKIVLLLLISLTAFIQSCKESEGSGAHAKHENSAQYTCPMHPEILRDKPGTCPICGMDLVPKSSNNELTVDSSLSALAKPVNSQIVSTLPVIIAESRSRIASIEVSGRVTYDERNQVSVASRIGGRIERLYIKYNYQPVRQGQLIMEVYSPEIAAAQRELLFLKNGSEALLLEKAKQRLLLLGMAANDISKVIRTGQIFYRVPVYSPVAGYVVEKSLSSGADPSRNASSTTGSSDAMSEMGSAASASPLQNESAAGRVVTSPTLIRQGQYIAAGQSVFTIYQPNDFVAEFSMKATIAAQIRKGDQLVFRAASNPQKTYTGKVGLIVPVVRSEENFIVIRLYLNESNILPGELLVANLPIVYSKAWWLPKKAVVQSGSRAFVFKKDQNVFKPFEVNVVGEANGMLMIATEIGEWNVAENAAFLVDSESFIRTTDSLKD